MSIKKMLLSISRDTMRTLLDSMICTVIISMKPSTIKCPRMVAGSSCSILSGVDIATNSCQFGMNLLSCTDRRWVQANSALPVLTVRPIQICA